MIIKISMDKIIMFCKNANTYSMWLASKKNYQNPLMLINKWNTNTRVYSKRTSKLMDLGPWPFWVWLPLQEQFFVKTLTSGLRWRLQARLFSSLAATPVLAMPLQDSWITWWVRNIPSPFKRCQAWNRFGKPQVWI